MDFDNFDITESTTAGTCTDSFAMTGPSGQNPLNLCGTLTDFHSEQNYSKHQSFFSCHLVKLICFKHTKKASMKTKLNGQKAKGSNSET